MNHSVLKLLFRLKKELSLKISNETLEEILLSHQDYPSMYSISDTLSKIGVENKMGRISSDQLLQLTPVFLAYSIEDGLVIVTKISNSQISYYNGSSSQVIFESIEDFIQKWNGIVILVDTEATIKVSKKDTLEKNIKRIKYIGLFTILSILTILTFNSNYGVFNLIFFTKLIGAIVSSLIISSEMNTIQKSKFCISNESINCDNVLNSRASKVLSWLSMSDLGLLYFSGGVLAIIISSITSNFESVIFLVNILSWCVFPYIFFSIYYQKQIIKKWCVLCLIIQAVFLLEGIISTYYFYTSDIALSQQGLFIFGLSFTIPVIVWSSLKKILYNYFSFKESMYKYIRLKNKSEIFNLLQQKENLFDTSFPENQIVFDGTNNTTKKATLIINPYCHLCAKEFQKIIEINKKDKGINFSLIFSESDHHGVSQLLIELYTKMEQSEFLSVLSNWFKHKNVKKLKKLYAIEASEWSKTTYTKHKQWCTQNNILQTPLTIFNNRRLSDHYTIEDLSLL